MKAIQYFQSTVKNQLTLGSFQSLGDLTKYAHYTEIWILMYSHNYSILLFYGIFNSKHNTYT